MIKILKKNGAEESFNGEKIKRAIRKSANRVCAILSEKEENKVVNTVKNQLRFNETAVPVDTIHNMVEHALDDVNPDVAKSYREYRDNKSQFAAMLDRVYSKKLSLNFVGDRSNANADSALVTTQKAIVYNELNSELYKKFFLNVNEERAMSDGYIYVHDRGSRLDTMNCCIFDMKTLLTGGFYMGNLDYSEPKSLDVAFDLIGDVTMNAASFQYGGFTIPEVDKLLAPYAEKSYNQYYNDFVKIKGDNYSESEADEYAFNKVRREFEQGFQSWEMKFNSVASSRGDYPFTAFTFGLGTSRFETLCSSVAMKVRKEGQGKDGFKHPVLFPKISFFYHEDLHGEGKPFEWLFLEAIDCSSKSMYPDFISMSGDGYAPSIYKKYGVAISRMGCINYDEKITVASNSKGKYEKNLMIGEFFKSVKDGRGFNYVSSRVKRIAKHISNESDRAKFEARGYIWYDGELMNQWAIDFANKNGRKPTRGDVKDFFGYDLHRKSTRKSRNIDSKLFNLWDSYLELKTVDELVKNGFEEKSSIGECSSDKHFIRNKMWHGEENGKECVRQLDIYFPVRKIGFEVQDFATHSRVDDEPYSINGMRRSDYVFKKGPTYSANKINFFKSLDISVYEIWEDEIRNNDYSILSANLSYEATKPNNEHLISEIHTEELDYIDLDLVNISKYVKDIDGSFVKIKKVIKNKNVTNWLKIILANKQVLNVTTDHPFITEAGQTLACDLSVGNALISDDEMPIIIESIEQVERTANSYDIETESGTFVFSGIQSHNCRAQTSPWFERGGMDPADDNDRPVYEGRFNMGAISLNFPMLAMKSKKEGKDFYEILTHYLDMCRDIHKRTFEYLSHKKAGINPLGFCQGGFYNGNKDPDEELGEDFLRPMTMSFGIIGLNEASIILTNKQIHEDNAWAIEVLKFINEYADKYKRIDNILWAIYGTPGESLCHTQIEQFRKKYGIVKDVSDHEYTTNSFHCNVRADINPVQKQDIEYPMFHLCNGGNIQYVRYRLPYNKDAMITLVRRAMKMGFYEGVNYELNWCEKCGHSFVDSDVCPKCGASEDAIVRIERMNGYLGYSKIRGKTMYSDAKNKEFSERVSM